MKINIKLSVLIIPFFFYSCVSLENEDVVLGRSGVEYSDIYNQEENIEVPEVYTQEGVERLLLYSFEQERIIDYSNYYTDFWDIAFAFGKENGSQRVTIFQNNKYSGYPIPGEGEVIGTLLKKNFHDISLAEDPEDMIYNRTRNHDGSFPYEIENPDEFNVIKGQGITGFDLGIGVIGDDYPIIFYVETSGSLPNGETYRLVNVLPERTFVFRTTVGNYVKMELQAVHKNQPDVITYNSEFFYLTFRYFIQKDGTRNLLTR